MGHCSFPGTAQGAGDPGMRSQGPALLMGRVGRTQWCEVHRGGDLTWLEARGFGQERLPGVAGSRDHLVGG